MEQFDVIVIGGGPAGMMAAAYAAERHSRVVLVEKNAVLGKKLLISGGGRCNVTNNKPVVRDLVQSYETAGKFLFSAFSQFGVTETINYFEERGVPFVEEHNGRMFPATHKASSIKDVLVTHMNDMGVIVKTSWPVTALSHEKKTGFVVTGRHNTITAPICIVATGGTSHPDTGSTGDGIPWLRTLGHTVLEDSTALVPLRTEESWSHTLGGVSLEDVSIKVSVDGDVIGKKRGKMLFTHIGVSGPAVLALSRLVGENLSAGVVQLQLDLTPHLEAGALRIILQDSLVTLSNKKVKNVLATIIPTALVAPILAAVGVDGETPAHSVRRSERTALVARIKSLAITVTGLVHEKAVVAGGGVALDEIDFKTMESKVVPRLYLVGDVININRPSGGYSLQLCWTTGALAGKQCA